MIDPADKQLKKLTDIPWLGGGGGGGGGSEWTGYTHLEIDNMLNAKADLVNPYFPNGVPFNPIYGQQLWIH